MERSLDKKKVILGLSGGVDSTTAALLLRENGYQVTGLYFDISEGNQEGKDAAERVASQIGIPFVYRNTHQIFEETVIDNFCREYLSGRTPNPCILCNPAVKFNVLIQEADRLGAFHIATGHYARTGFDPALGWTIRQAASQKKDQSYMLYRLSSSVIQRLLLPLSEMADKEAAREIARRGHMSNAEAKDSQEICFLPRDLDYIQYIKEKGFDLKEGNFINKEGEILGRHKGLACYTIGQRKGLGVTFGKPVFVTKLDPKTGNITLGDHEELFSREVICADCFFPSSDGSQMPDFLEGKRVLAKIRYAAKPSPAVIEKLPGGRVKAVFEEKQRAATPGQSIVFYIDGCVVGGGFID
ncbi:tRNA 2-thiouridine(34) synthase MnmA [bacterium 210820-DFI.6.37]|nr:tRNA 2-thiouridine(34) synthase MnmA [bacterium 210820-DFI.6.37]